MAAVAPAAAADRVVKLSNNVVLEPGSTGTQQIVTYPPLRLKLGLQSRDYINSYHETTVPFFLFLYFYFS